MVNHDKSASGTHLLQEFLLLEFFLFTCWQYLQGLSPYCDISMRVDIKITENLLKQEFFEDFNQ